jgi:hypothetical protein
MDYCEILSALTLPKIIVDCACGRVSLPRFTFDAPPRLSYGYPVGLIPLLSTGDWPGYVGVFRDWSDCHSSPYFVEYFAETQRMTSIGDTARQFLTSMAYSFYCNVPDDDEIMRFCRDIGLPVGKGLDDLFLDVHSRDDLVALPCFVEGEMPSRGFRIAEWTRPATQSELERMMDEERVADIWHALNSPGWDQLNCPSALRFLRQRFGSTLFASMVECWEELFWNQIR